MNACHTPCPCWASDSALGHPGHCCFLVDDRSSAGFRIHDWRADDDVCAPPRSADDALDRTANTERPNAPFDQQEPPC